MLHVVGRRYMLLLLSLFCILDAQPAPATPWADVCTAEEYDTPFYKKLLCPEVYFVSTIAFDPLEPKQSATLTLILKPSQTLCSNSAAGVNIHVTLPHFEPHAQATVDPNDALNRLMTVTANNAPIVGQASASGYNTVDNPLFISPAKWSTKTSTLMLQIYQAKQCAKFLSASHDTEIRICCLVMPKSSPRDFVNYTIREFTSLSTNPEILQEPVMRSPYLDPGFQFAFLQVMFNPPLSQHFAVIQLTLRSATDLSNRNRIILHVPSITRIPAVSGVIEFNTAASADATDWMLFAHEALWDNAKSTITFFLRTGATLVAGKQVTLRTNPNEFMLPVDIESNWPKLKVEARSFDDIDMIIRPTEVYQASRVPHVRNFTFSMLEYDTTVANHMSNVKFTFMTNRPMFAGQSILLRLAGFQAQVVDIFLIGPSGKHFENQRGRFDLPANTIELKVNRTIYSNEYNFTVLMADLFLPPATYQNDEALLVKTSENVAEWQAIMFSPAIGPGTKEFVQSQLLFRPLDPRMPANITIIIKPSVVFYQGDVIILHLYGFTYLSQMVPLHGPKAHYIKNSQAIWHATDTRLLLEVAPNEIILNTEAFTVDIHQSSNFRLPDKLSQNDGICRIEGRVLSNFKLIHREPMKKTQMVGDVKFVIDSRIDFLPEPPGLTLSDSIARISFQLILNTDVLPNSTLYIKLGGLSRPAVQPQSGKVKLSGANAPLFTNKEGDWSAETNYLKVKIIPYVQIYSGERIRFFLEYDQKFKLPYAMYPRDPSFRIWIPEAGISERAFNFSTRVIPLSGESKGFVKSQLWYGAYGSLAYPHTEVDVQIQFQPNVIIPAGSIVRIKLPGFTYPNKRVPIRSPDIQQNGFNFLADAVSAGSWDQAHYHFDFLIPTGKYLPRTSVCVLRVLKADGGFITPQFSLEPNDLRLTIAVVENQIIREESIRESPRVVARSFAISTFDYLPAVPQSIFQLKMTLMPTVNITSDNPIYIKLDRFNNTSPKPPCPSPPPGAPPTPCPINVHVSGASRAFIKDSMAQWDPANRTLKMGVPADNPIIAFTVLELAISEAMASRCRSP
jgi:hypothetical protein